MMETFVELMKMHDKGLVNAYLLVFHKTHADRPIEFRDFLLGFPSTPFACDCGETIESSDDLEFDFAFIAKMSEPIVISNLPQFGTKQDK